MMSGNDDPFGPEPERTIIAPNPGLRRPPPSSAPSRPSSPYTPASAPAYRPERLPPQPVDRPFGASEPYPGPRGADEGVDSWITAERGDVQQSATLGRAEDLRFEELVARNENPIMHAAAPLLLLLGRLRVAALRASFASLMEQVAAAIDFFDKEMRASGIAREQANVAKYLICATADDIVQNIPTEDRHVWTQYSMLSRFFGERTGGVRFFEELERLKRDPATNYNVLELQHACLALGFQGVHRTSAGGLTKLQLIQRDLYENLRRQRQRGTRILSPRWRGQAFAMPRSHLTIPLWSIAGVIALALFALFLVLRSMLGGQSDAVATALIGLHPNGKITLQRRVAEKPAPLPPQVVTQLQRIRAQLSDEIARGVASADYYGKWISIRLGAVTMFDSGQAKLLPQFSGISEKIAKIVDKEAGPIRIVGHTDNQPLSVFNHFKNNQQLSIERANAVAALLRPMLTDPNRISTDGRGPDEPVADNNTPQGKARNRRVEVLVTRVDRY
ncbi:type IVB secretion system protein IcmH/DotU [Methylocystis heyeri]|nr:type IVB secretion system protein IcmH/DotU [Methylocystis heyeri]